MRCEKISENLYFFQRGWLNANHFAYVDERVILIDTGYITHFPDTERLLNSMGVEIQRVGKVISTHSHCDHIGGNTSIQEASGCSIGMHPIDKHFIDQQDDWATWWRYYHQEGKFFRVDEVLEDGDELSLGEMAFRVFHVPGHAAGMIALYAPDAGILISSDAIWDGDLGVLNTRVEGSIAPFLARESLLRLSRLKIDTIYPGHGPRIDNPSQALQKCLQKLSRLIADRKALGKDEIKKILIYTLLMRKEIPKDDLFPLLMETYWFPGTVEMYLQGDYRGVFIGIVEELIARGIITLEEGMYRTTVKP